MEKENKSLWEVFKEVPDGRGRQGRIHRLTDLLAMIFIAVMAGETTLRGIVQWLTERKTEWMKCKRLELWRMPSYSTYYWALRKLEMDAFSEKVLGWLGEEDKGNGRYSMDGKSLRGSKRAGKQALKVDVTFNEDRQTARHIAPPLSLFRDLVISLIRRAGFPFVPDGRRYAQAHYHQLFPWRLFPSSGSVNS